MAPDARVKPAVLGFDRADTASAYDRTRPPYPAEAVAHIVGHGRILARTHPDLAGRPWFGFPYITRIWWCRALGPRR